MLESGLALWSSQKIKAAKEDGKVSRLSLSRIDIPISPDTDPSTTSASLSGQNPGQIIFVHEIFLFALLPSATGHSPDVFFLVLCQHKIPSPSTFAATISGTCPLLIRPPARRLRDAKYISLVVPLHVGFQMQLHFPFSLVVELTRVKVGFPHRGQNCLSISLVVWKQPWQRRMVCFSWVIRLQVFGERRFKFI